MKPRRLSTRIPALRPAIVCEDVGGLEIYNIKARIVADVTLARIVGVNNLVIRNSRVLEGMAAK